MDVSHLHAFLPEASHGVAFSKSVLISTSTEISLWAWVWFPTFSAAMLSHAGKHTHIHTHIHTHTYTTHTHTHGDRRGWGEDTTVRGRVWNTHIYIHYKHTHIHIHMEIGEDEARTLLSEVMFGTHTCTHPESVSKALIVSDHTMGWHSNRVGQCVMFESNIACFFQWQHTWKSTHTHIQRERLCCWV